MAKQPSKGFASKGNNVPYVKNTGKAASDNAVSDGGRQGGGTEPATSGNAATESKTGYAELVKAVKEHNSTHRSDLVSRAFFPNGKDGVAISTQFADVPVLQGDFGYQLSTGEVIKL